MRFGSERQINLLDPLPRTPANGLLGSQSDSEATALPNGNFVLVYTNNAGGQGDFDILGVELTAAGSVVAGSTFRVDYDAGKPVLRRRRAPHRRRLRGGLGRLRQ